MTNPPGIFGDPVPARLQPNQYVVIVDPKSCGGFANVVEGHNPYQSEARAGQPARAISYIDVSTPEGQAFFNRMGGNARFGQEYPMVFKADGQGHISNLTVFGRGNDRALDAIKPHLGAATPDGSMEGCFAHRGTVTLRPGRGM